MQKKNVFDKIVSRQGNPEDFVYDDMEEEIEYGQISHNAISPAAEIDLTNFVLVLLLIFNLFFNSNKNNNNNNFFP